MDVVGFRACERGCECGRRDRGAGGPDTSVQGLPLRRIGGHRGSQEGGSERFEKRLGADVGRVQRGGRAGGGGQSRWAGRTVTLEGGGWGPYRSASSTPLRFIRVVEKDACFDVLRRGVL